LFPAAFTPQRAESSHLAPKVAAQENRSTTKNLGVPSDLENPVGEHHHFQQIAILSRSRTLNTPKSKGTYQVS
jgi:hypothetical protein